MSGPNDPTTSGTSNYNPVATRIITRAFRIMGIINDEEAPTPSMMVEGMNGLNSLVKELQATGIHVWTEEEAVLFLQQYQRMYKLGSPPGYPPTPDHCAPANSWSQNQLAAGASAGATTIQVTSTQGITVGYKIGIVTANNNLFWTTVKAAPSGFNVPLTTGLPAGANANGFVFTYEKDIVRPLRVPFARRLQYAQNPIVGQVSSPDWGGIITPLTPMFSRREFFDLPQPNTPGQVTNAFYDPRRSQGELWVWNVPSNVNFGLRFTYYRPIMDFDSLDDAPDLPQEWNTALNWNLADELMLDYSVGPQRSAAIEKKAAMKLQIVSDFDREPESVYFGRASSQSRG